MSRRGVRFRGRGSNPGIISGSFLPSKLTGLALWLRADLGITIGTGVSAWADQSGSGDANKNVAQATGAAQPTYTATDATFNGKSTLTLDGTDDQLLAAGSWAVAPPTTGTLFIVWKSVGTGFSFPIVDRGSNVYEFYQNTGANTDLRWFLSADLTSVSTSLNVKSICAIDMNGASSKIFQNAKTTPLVTGNPGTVATFGLNIGRAGLGNCTIAEIIIYSTRLSAANFGAVMDYLGSRYAITVAP